MLAGNPYSNNYFMKFFSSLILSGFFISLCAQVNAQPININTAKKIAQNHLLSVGKNNLKSARVDQTKMQFHIRAITSATSDTLYYVLNDTVNHSFVIVSGDERAWPIIGYSTEKSFDVNNQPPAFKAWMENREQELEYIKTNNLQPDVSIKTSWNNLTAASQKNSGMSVEPLLKTQWGQGCFYNEKCPVPPISFNCGHSPTGCVATSMAQIMKYWNYPTNGTGSHSYLNIFGTQSADFVATTYQWKQMPNKVSSSNDAVATLMYHCGVSVDMIYKNNESGAFDPRDELVKYFGYSADAEFVDKRAFLPNDWVNLLKTELNQGRPIYYEGKPGLCEPGHAFVCDGYQDSDYFHFNWGWDGQYDGYFYLNNLNPGFNSLTNLQYAIIKIFPQKLPDGYRGIILSSKTIGVGNNGGIKQVKINSSESWLATCDQSWVTLNRSNGTIGNDSIEISVQPNPVKSPRTANIAVSANGFSTQNITVTQYGTTPITAGNLRTKLGSDISSITSLKLEGTIDARDFKVMRDEMPELTEIDLSNATILEYTGTEGPIGDGNYTYAANAIPNFAFLLNPNLSKFRLQSVILPENTESIMDYAFQGCNHLKIGRIPSSVKLISNGAFVDCSATEAFLIPSSVLTIGDNAFANFNGSINVDPNNPNYSSIDGVLFNKDKTILIRCPVSKKGDFTIPSSVTTLMYGAFHSCNNIESVTIPSSVTKIYDGAFENCKSLKSVFIPSSVTFIGNRAFAFFNGVFTVDTQNPTFTALEGVLFNKDQSELLQCPVAKTGTYTIPSTVLKLRPDAFIGCVNISSIVIPPFIKDLSDILIDCYGLTSIYSQLPLPIQLSESAFYAVDKVECKLYVPYGTKALYRSTDQWQKFEYIEEMPGLYISDNTLSFDMNGGQNQLSLSSSSNWNITSNQPWLTFEATSGKAGLNSVSITASANQTMSFRKATITISAEGSTPQEIEVTQYSTVEVTAGNLKTVLDGKLSGIKSLTLSGTIDARDFKTMRDEMPSLAEINLMNTTIVEYTGPGGPVDCSNCSYWANILPSQSFRYQGFGNNVLKSIVLPESTKEIGQVAFDGCKALKRVVLSDSVKTIYFGAFYYFKGDLVVSDTNPYLTVSDGVLFNKAKTTLMLCFGQSTGVYTIPKTVKNIEDNAFVWCSGLTGVIIPQSVSEFGQGLFTYCMDLEFANIPSSVKAIPENTFMYCKKLKSITIPSSVTSIRHYAFAYCDSISSIHACSQVPVDISASFLVFDGIDKNTCSLYVPFGSKALYASANQWKDFKNIIENDPPVANAGAEQIVKENYPVLLDGSNSLDINHDKLTYLWTAPDGITLSSDTTQSPSFEAPEVQVDTDFKFLLKVDDSMNSTTDEVTIKVKQINKAPSADAGKDMRIKKNRNFMLDGSASSDPDNDSLTYKWIAPDGITLSSDKDANPTFTTPDVIEDTNFTFSLKVNDGEYDSYEDQINIIVTPNNAPVAEAGSDQLVYENNVFVTLDGSGSYDQDNDELTYKWTSPFGFSLSSDTVQKPVFTVPEVLNDTTFIFRLVVSDGTDTSLEDLIAITVKNVDRPPYLKKTLQNISVDKRAPALTIDLNSVFGDYDINDVLSYMVTSNTNSQIVTTLINKSDLILDFSVQFIGKSEITITAISNEKEISTNFTVEVKAPTGIEPLVYDPNFELYPNPTAGKVKIVFGSIPARGSKILVNDVSGKVILKQAILEKEVWIDLTGNPHGIYLVKSNLKDSKIQKVILK